MWRVFLVRQICLPASKSSTTLVCIGALYLDDGPIYFRPLNTCNRFELAPCSEQVLLSRLTSCRVTSSCLGQLLGLREESPASPTRISTPFPQIKARGGEDRYWLPLVGKPRAGACCCPLAISNIVYHPITFLSRYLIPKKYDFF